MPGISGFIFAFYMNTCSSVHDIDVKMALQQKKHHGMHLKVINTKLWE